MRVTEFNTLMEDRFKKCRMVLARKAQEYGPNDRGHNFKRAAGALGWTPEQALLGMMMKHIISIIDMVHDGARNRFYTHEQWDEKIGDAISYLILLEGLVKEKQEASCPTTK